MVIPAIGRDKTNARAARLATHENRAASDITKTRLRIVNAPRTMALGLEAEEIMCIKISIPLAENNCRLRLRRRQACFAHHRAMLPKESCQNARWAVHSPHNWWPKINKHLLSARPLPRQRPRNLRRIYFKHKGSHELCGLKQHVTWRPARLHM